MRCAPRPASPADISAAMTLRQSRHNPKTGTVSKLGGDSMNISLTRYVLTAAAWLVAASAPAQDYKAILSDANRPQAERDIDAVRKPEEMLKFYGVKPGDKVADLMASRGYYTALLSQAVGAKGVVYSASPTVRDETRERFKAPQYANVKIVEGPMASVGLPQDGSLDFVLLNLDYHEIEKADRAAMNKRVFAALKPGGSYGAVDQDRKSTRLNF